MKFSRQPRKSKDTNSYRFIVQIELPAFADSEFIIGPDDRRYPVLSEQAFEELSEKIHDAVDTIVNDMTGDWPLRTSVHSVPELIDFE